MDMLDQARGADVAAVLAGGGEMGALMRAMDWAATPLGPAAAWPRSLITSVTLILESRYPMMVLWGSDLIQFYNDAFRPILGATKHPAALGQRAADCWAEIWEVIGPLFASVRETGEAIWMDDLLLLLHRYGYLEETHFAFSYSPIRDETGGIGGLLVTCTETTAQVLGERRLRTLRELAARTAEVKAVEEVCMVAAATLAENAADIPFALLYLLDAAGTSARLIAATDLEAAGVASPPWVDLTADAEGCWPLAQVIRTGRAAPVGNLLAHPDAVDELAGIPVPAAALVLPVARAGQERPAGLLVAGISQRRALDDEYRGFFDLVAAQVAAAIANARAYEEERKRAEALAELDRAKTAFFSNVSHEFRTPLTLALAPVEDALADTSEPLLRAERDHLESAHRNSLRLLRLVNALLDFSRIEAGRVEASYEPTDLAALTADLASVFRAAVERAGLRLLVDCPPLPEPAYVDREMWEKIVLNLLSNAFKFTFAGEIAVTLRQAGDRVELVIRDTGIGIPAEELPNIFERFYRVRDARGRTHEGTGIGLALVRELVRLHGGTIDVESVVNGGTTVTVALPLGAGHLPAERIGAARTLASTALGAAPYVEEALRWLPDAEPEQTEANGLPGAGTALLDDAMMAPAPARARVLLADDNADMRAYLRRLLGERYAVEAVTNGAEALAAARARTPDLVLADVMMPVLDGFTLLRELRADPRTRDIPIILLSARAGQEARVEGLEAGADDYLVKPFAARELLARIEGHLRLARVRTQGMERERALRAEAEAAQQRYRAIAETANEGIWLIDREAHTLFANPRMAALLGISVDDLLAGTVLDFVFEADRPRAEDRIGQNLVGMSEQFDFRFRRVDGAPVEVLACTSPLRAEDGAIVGALGMFSDITARLRMDQLLRRQATLLALSRDAIIVRDPRGTIITWSGGAAALYGWTAAEAIGQVTHDLLRARILPAGANGREIDIILAAHGTWEGELEHTRRDGTRVVVESRQSLLRGADGTPEAILEVNRDIATRRALASALERLQVVQTVSDAALALIELPSLLRQVLDLITSALGADNTAILLLDEAEQTLVVHHAQGPEAAQVGQVRVPVGQGVAGRIAATRQPLVIDDLRSVEPVNPLLREQLASLMGVPLLIKDRLIGVMHVDSATPRHFTDDDLHLLQLVADRVALALENARLYEAERAARETITAERDRLRQILDTLPVGVVIVDAQGRVDLLNQAGQDIVGLDTRGQSLPSPGDEHHEGYRMRRPDGTPYPAAEVPLNRSLRTGERVHGEPQVHLHATTGRETPLLVNSAPLRDGSGAIVGAVSVFQDITELRAWERAREEFLYSAAHDLKNPLTAIRAVAQLAERRLARLGSAEAEPVLGLLARMQASTDAMVTLINELIDVARQQMGGALDLHREATDLVALARACVEAQREASGRPIHLEAGVPELRASVDATRIERVVGNLLSNALKYSPPDRPITVRIGRDDGVAVLSVHDEGIGIPAADLPHIFDRFQRAGNVVGHIQGTGIGLASARAIVAQHGGTIAAESIEGAGSTFTVRLPLGDP